MIDHGWPQTLHSHVTSYSDFRLMRKGSNFASKQAANAPTAGRLGVTQEGSVKNHPGNTDRA